MTLRVLFALLVCVSAAYSQLYPAQGADSPYPQANSPVSIQIRRVQCFGLARRTRQIRLAVPILYNVKTRQAVPMPKFLHYADDSTIAQLENEGWEVRRKLMSIPQIMYARVPVCCPFDPSCSQANDEDTSNAAPMAPGPVISVASTPSPYQDMVRQAALWRQRVLSAQQQQMFSPSASSSMMSPRDHMLQSMAGPYAQQAAMWHQQMLRAKIAQMQAMMAQQGNNYGQMPQQPQGISPIDVMRAMQQRGGNPYSAIDGGRMNMYDSMHDTDGNPYSGMATPGQLPPNVMRAIYAMQQMHRQGNSGMSQGPLNPHVIALLHRMQNQGQPQGMNPYGAPPQGMPGPQPGSPWAQGPLNQQQGPGPMMNDPRMSSGSDLQKRLMALAVYQQMMNQRRARMGAGNDAMNRPPMDMPRPLPPLSGMDLSNQQPQGNDATTRTGDEQNTEGTDLANDVLTEDPATMGAPTNKEPPMGMGRPVNSQPPVQVEQPINGQQPPMPMGRPVNGQPPMPMGQPMNGQPPMPMGGPGSGQQPQMPSPEEMQIIQKCQGTLEPKLNECLQVHDLTLEQFMNPEYMQKAKKICEAKETVGPCIMQLDTVCGAETVDTTRKMIASVLQMMGMICQQITARGDAAMPPAQQGGMPPMPPQQRGMPPMPPQQRGMPPMPPQQGGMPPMPPMRQGGIPAPPMPSGGVPESPMEREMPRAPLGSAPPSPDVPPMPTEEEMPAEEPTVFEENLTEEVAPPTQTSNDDKTDTTKHSGHEKPATAANTGHDAAHPVSQELQVLGYPLWLVITLALVLFVAVILAFVVVCLCVRRRRKTKTVDLEIQKVPMPLESKLSTIGIPPPSYTTTAVQQNHDGLALPPLDLADESVEVPIDDSIDEKPKLEEDADDESDEKDATDEKDANKKKEKKDKN